MALTDPAPSAEYEIRVKDTAGNLLAVLTDWSSFTYSKKINEPGSFSVTFDDTDPYRLDPLVAFGLDYRIEFWRYVPGFIARYIDFAGFHRGEARETAANGQKSVTSSGPGYADLLNRRFILYAENSGYASKRGPAETVMKAYVSENAAAAATFPPRARRGVWANFTVEADGGLGTIWMGDHANANLAETLRAIALDTGDCDFGVEDTGTGFEFKTYSPRYGTDRTAPPIAPAGLNAAGNVPHTFSVDFGSMETPRYINLRENEGGVVVALGTGQFGDRKVAIVEGPNVADSPWNDAEVVINSPETSTQGLLDDATAAAAGLKPLQEIAFTPIQTRSSIYGRDYAHGDLVTARYDEIEIDLRIIGVTVGYAGGVESLALEVGLAR